MSKTEALAFIDAFNYYFQGGEHATLLASLGEPAGTPALEPVPVGPGRGSVPGVAVQNPAITAPWMLAQRQPPPENNSDSNQKPPENSSNSNQQPQPVTKQTSEVWKKLKPFQGQTKTNGLNGKQREYYEWDHTHSDIEVYDRNGVHKGSMDPATGTMTKPPVPGRKINI